MKPRLQTKASLKHCIVTTCCCLSSMVFPVFWVKYLEIVDLENCFTSSWAVLENVNCGDGGPQQWWLERSMPGLCGGSLLDKKRLYARSVLVPGYFLLLTHMAWCIGKVLGPGIRAVKWSEVTQLCPTLCDPMGCSLPCSSVHGIFQAIVLEWIAVSFLSLPVIRFFDLGTSLLPWFPHLWDCRLLVLLTFQNWKCCMWPHVVNCNHHSEVWLLRLLHL